MAHQTQMNSNGHSESPPRAVARSLADFWHDLMVLFELQGQLLMVELREGARHARWACLVLLLGVLLALSCVPVGLAAAGMLLAELGTLTMGQAFLAVFAAGLVVSAALVYGSLRVVKQGVSFMRRSKAELSENVQWAKCTLKRLGPRSEAAVR